MKNTSLSSKVCLLLAGMAFLNLPAPSFAQADEDIVVTGRFGPVPDNMKSLSQTVAYSDLDLSTQEGRAILHHRLKLTARYLCNKLGEPASEAVGPSCRDAAVKDAMDRIGTVEAHYAPRRTGWVPGPAWAAPYPSEWERTYP